MANDFDLGSGSIVVNSKRNVFRMDWMRDKSAKTETMNGYIQQVNRNDDTNAILSIENYIVRLTDDALKSCDGHNKFLNDVKAMINQCVAEFRASGSVVNPISGSVEQLDGPF